MSRTVVLIDDDPDDLELMKEALAEVDPTIHCFSFIYPEEAIKALLGRELNEKPHTILIDMNMPVLSGDKCLKLIRAEERFDDIVVAMYSTSMPQPVAESLKRHGANFVFEKPVRLSGYSQMIKSILK